jgi:transposase InsO family protein
MMPSIRLGTGRDLKHCVRTLEQTYEQDGTHRRPTPTRTLTDTWPSQTHSHAADGHRLSDAIFDYIEGWYNTRRLYSYLGYLSPAQYESLIHQVG